MAALLGRWPHARLDLLRRPTRELESIWAAGNGPKVRTPNLTQASFEPVWADRNWPSISEVRDSRGQQLER